MGREAMLLLLTWAAGSMDAMSYLGLGHVFTAMMTGNTVLLGLALGQGHILVALRSILALAGFAGGVAAGTLIVQQDQRQGDWPPAVTRALTLEGILLGVFALTWHVAGTERSATERLSLRQRTRCFGSGASDCSRPYSSSTAVAHWSVAFCRGDPHLRSHCCLSLPWVL